MRCENLGHRGGKGSWRWVLMPFLFLGTTYVVQEGGREVGRYEEKDGRDAVEIVDNAAKGNRAAVSTEIKKPAQRQYEWYQNSRGLEAALQHHKKTGEPVFLYFHASWCPVCAKYDREVFPDREVRQFLAPFVKVKIDEAKERKLMEQYKIQGFPTFLVISKAGKKEVGRYSNPSRFVQECRKAGMVPVS
jgi:thioredoxin-related protein